MRDYNHIPTDKANADVQIFVAPQAVANNEWDTWRKPKGVSMVHILCIGGGGGGGAGFQAAAGSARGGGGGGSSGGVSRLLVPAFLLPDILYVEAAIGGKGDSGVGDQTSGQISRVVIYPTSTLEPTNTLLISSNGVATFGGSGTGAAAGAGGAAATIATITNCPLAGLGRFQAIAGDAGTAGGAQTGAVGAAHTIPATSVVVVGGVGGGGVTTTDFAGGSLTAISNSWISQQRAANSAAGIDGSGGFTLWNPFFSFPGMGGGTSNSGQAGHGGNGSYGSGGGGGGGGATRGRGGDGGQGIVIITSW